MNVRKLWHYVFFFFFHSRLKHNVMVFGCWETVFSGRCYSILRLIICCEKRKECHRRGFCCVLFLLSMFDRFLLDFDLLLILLRIVLWPLLGKIVPSAFHCSNFKCRLGCACPVWCLGWDVELDCIGSWSLPFCLLSQSTQAQGRRRVLKSGPAMGRRKRSPSARDGESTRGGFPPLASGVWGISPEKILGSERL